MPLDMLTLPPVHREIVTLLTACFGERTFTASAAAVTLGRPRGSTATYLSMLVRAGAVFRTKYGLYCCVEPREEECGKSVSTMEKILRETANEALEAKPIIPEIIDTADKAERYLVGRGIIVKRVGAVFLIDGRQRVTEEKLIVIANKRRDHVPVSQRPKSMAAYMPPGSIPFPKPLQMMGAR